MNIIGDYGDHVFEHRGIYVNEYSCQYVDVCKRCGKIDSKYTTHYHYVGKTYDSSQGWFECDLCLTKIYASDDQKENLKKVLNDYSSGRWNQYYTNIEFYFYNEYWRPQGY